MPGVDSERVFKAMGHCWPMDTFSEEEVKEVASKLGMDPHEAWSAYEKAVTEAQDTGPPAMTVG